MRGLPFVLADVEILVARGTPPVDAPRRLAREEAPVLPEILARTGALAPMQAVDHGRGDAARLQDQARHAVRERARLPARVLRRPDLLLVGASLGRHSIIRCGS